MADSERIMFRLATLRKTGNPLVLPLGMKAVATTGKNLVGICLMTDVPDYVVTWRIKAVVQSDRQFDRSEVGAEVTARGRNRFQQEFPDLSRKFRQLFRF